MGLLLTQGILGKAFMLQGESAVIGMGAWLGTIMFLNVWMIIWPNQNSVGTHVNVSGAAVTASAKNLDNAIKLIEFLAGDAAQEIYAGTVNEYPIRDGIALAPVVASWGEFKADDLELSLLGKHNAEAVRIADRVGWQ